MSQVARHRRWGWASLATFAGLGLVLESLHGFKLATLVDHETRQTMWRLAHAHGAVLGLIHLALAQQLATQTQAVRDQANSSSIALCVATVAMPLGFGLGGAWYYGSDPGVGIVLVPIGGVALIYACLRLALASRRET